MTIKLITRDLTHTDKQSRGELTRGVNYVLAVAIDTYHHQGTLYNCVKDAKDIINILLLNYAFARDYVTELYDECATRDNIVVALERVMHLMRGTQLSPTREHRQVLVACWAHHPHGNALMRLIWRRL